MGHVSKMRVIAVAPVISSLGAVTLALVNDNTDELIVKKWGAMKIALSLFRWDIQRVSYEVPISFDHSCRCPQKDCPLQKAQDLGLG